MKRQDAGLLIPEKKKTRARASHVLSCSLNCSLQALGIAFCLMPVQQ